MIQLSESISIAANSASVNGKLPLGLGSFKCTDFLILGNVNFDGRQVLSIWKNMLLIIGDINEISVRKKNKLFEYMNLAECKLPIGPTKLCNCNELCCRNMGYFKTDKSQTAI